MNVNAPNNDSGSTIHVSDPTAATGVATDGGDTPNTAVSGDWMLRLARIFITRSDNKLNDLMNDADTTNATDDVLAELAKQLEPFANGMDHRDNGKDGDAGAKALNGDNVKDALTWNADIDNAIAHLPADSPVAQQLAELKFKDQALDPNTFICSFKDMSDLQARFAKIQKATDQDASMQTFLAQQAMNDRSTVITLLSGIQQEFAKTLDGQVAKI
jgi:hypothetical protein